MRCPAPLHLRMSGDVWRWAGKHRTSARNLGVDHWTIEVALRQALDDAVSKRQ
jgi:fido (protein-threonine AMPylation protein)